MCDLPTALATQVLTWEINGTLSLRAATAKEAKPEPLS